LIFEKGTSKSLLETYPSDMNLDNLKPINIMDRKAKNMSKKEIIE
jgi:hypothetical protein